MVPQRPGPGQGFCNGLARNDLACNILAHIGRFRLDRYCGARCLDRYLF